jgi:transposase
MIEVLHSHCAGIDVHKKFVSVCRLLTNGKGAVQKEIRCFGTVTREIEALAAWLTEGQVSHVAMESTGVYWQPIYNLLEDRFTILLVNPQAIKRMPGRKTDVKDAEWIATLLQHGLLQASYIPDPQQRELRELVRYRQSLLQERARFVNRLQKVLEGTNIKLASVVSDVQGVSAQAMLRAMVNGESNAKVLAEMAVGHLRRKRDQLEEALQGKVSAHQRFMLQQVLGQLDFLTQQIQQIETRIDEQLAGMPAPFQAAVRLLVTIPGVNRQLAILIVAEIGVDMSRFPTDRHIAAWAGVAPGNNQTGGKQRSGKTRKGNKYLQSGLVLAAHGAARSKDTYLRSLYRRLAARRGKSRAAVAVAHTILQAAYYMLKRGSTYEDLGVDYLDRLDRERTAKRLVKRLHNLGFLVEVKEQVQPAAEDSPPNQTAPPLPLAA